LEFIARQEGLPPHLTLHTPNRSPKADQYESNPFATTPQSASKTSATSPPDTIRIRNEVIRSAEIINWDVTPKKRSMDAYNMASDISSMIDATVGVIATPTVKTPPPPSLPMGLSHNYLTDTGASPISPFTPTKYATDMICIKVHQAYYYGQHDSDLINPYVTFDWGSLGKASTHALSQTWNPTFNSTLKFKSPAPQGAGLEDVLLMCPPISITLQSRGEGGDSDRLLGRREIDDLSRLDFKNKFGISIELMQERGGKSRVKSGKVEFDITIV
jgi:hypothetical protein